MLACYFPNQSPEDQELEIEFRHAVASLPESTRLKVYEALSSGRPSYQATEFVQLESIVVARQAGRDIAFPRPVPLVKLSHILFGYEELLQRKYCLPGFVEVEPGDVVIDCGAYVGGFSLSACRIAGRVHAFEPDEENFQCLTQNLGNSSNVSLNLEGLYNETKTMTLNISASSVEHSLLQPDDGQVVRTRDIQVRSLSDYCRNLGIESIDFCKIEAEGVEIEVFEGLKELRPRKLAIDVSPERNGESPAPEFRKRLTELGYDLQQRGNVLFARLDRSPEEHSMRTPPKVIYSLWLQGREKAPQIVQYNFARWERLNPDYELKVLDSADVDTLLEGFPLPLTHFTPQSLSDIVRLFLLSSRGGIWVDASVLPVSPLADWLPEVIAATGFFAFERQDVPLSSWFLCSTAGNIITESWWAEVKRLWTVQRAISSKIVIPPNPAQQVEPEYLRSSEEVPYFWVHCLFQLLLERNPLVTDIWQRRSHLSAAPAHGLQNLFGVNKSPTDVEIRRAVHSSFVQKLDWRVPYPIERIDQMLAAGPVIDVPPSPSLLRRLARRVKAVLVGANGR